MCRTLSKRKVFGPCALACDESDLIGIGSPVYTQGRRNAFCPCAFKPSDANFAQPIDVCVWLFGARAVTLRPAVRVISRRRTCPVRNGTVDCRLATTSLVVVLYLVTQYGIKTGRDGPTPNAG